MKRYFVLGLMLSMLLAISACGGPAVDPTTIPTTAPVTEPPATEPPATEPPATEHPATEPPAECSHSWNEATCTIPKTCSKCGATEGVVTAHNFQQEKCIYCGKINSGGISDNTPPVLEYFEIVENGQELKVGDTVHIKMKVTDDSGINVKRTYAVVHNGDHNIWFTWNYNESTGYMEGSYTFKETDVLGTYSVSYVPCYDIYDNYLHGSASGYVKLSSGGISDNTPPVLEYFEIVENGQELKVGDTVHIKMKVTDDSGINVKRTYAVVHNGDHNIWFTWNYNESTGYMEGSYTFKETDVLGTYAVGYVPCYDIYDNYLHGSANGYVKFVS